ncbi:hypothetical protein FHX42_003265 [Saccharopolyspora lacisalsi]|uniref:Uncharacterized protein n=1 Tax=Halosaccharopolyspora lacisalsi TaxID=1000566 RepID=A0A839DYU9_9PSEU|nr:hypothetical protein [Halosaccharopolyspora lacisalsi]MBA8825899.1 hypothetical protein [Halosaccharopolyspora lacisalsi]
MLAGEVSGAGEESVEEPSPWSMSEDEFATLVQEIADEDVPRVFALVEEFGARECAGLYAWGVEVGDRASVFAEDGTAFAHCDSAAGAHEMFSLIRRVHLVWPGRGSESGPEGVLSGV